MIRGAFEFQGQKCSAASRAYVPRSVWARLKDDLVAEIEAISMGDVTDLSHFMGAVIDERAFAKHKAAITRAKRSSNSAASGRPLACSTRMPAALKSQLLYQKCSPGSWLPRAGRDVRMSSGSFAAGW